MSKLKVIAIIVLLVAFVACSSGGLVPTVDAGKEPTTPVEPGEGPITPMELEEITVTVEHPYPVNIRPEPKHPGIPGVTVTCTVGCEGQPTVESFSY